MLILLTQQTLKACEFWRALSLRLGLSRWLLFFGQLLELVLGASASRRSGHLPNRAANGRLSLACLSDCIVAQLGELALVDDLLRLHKGGSPLAFEINFFACSRS